VQSRHWHCSIHGNGKKAAHPCTVDSWGAQSQN
jgi:hypothetical protein